MYMEDEKIIALYYERNEKAIDETAQKYGRMIRSIAYHILKNAPDSEECENDTYHTAWKKIPPANPPYLAAFLGRIARNISFDKYDYNSASKRNSAFALALSELADCIGTAGNAEEIMEQKETAGYISNFLRGTERIKRIVFIRRYWYCDDIRDIAKAYGFSESKVKSMLMRTRNQLKKYLEKQEVSV